MVVVTFSGLHGAGKSVYAKDIASEFDLRYVSAGELFRQIARDRDLTITELTDIAARDSLIDKEMDERTRREVDKGSVVLDGQLTGWFAEKSADIKIFLKARLDIRVARLALRDGLSPEDARKELHHREIAERKRYKTLYGIDIGDLSIYEVILDTSFLGLESTKKVLRTIIREYILAEKR